jgi:hypothetical protein
MDPHLEEASDVLDEVYNRAPWIPIAQLEDRVAGNCHRNAAFKVRPDNLNTGRIERMQASSEAEQQLDKRVLVLPLDLFHILNVFTHRSIRAKSAISAAAAHCLSKVPP